jgi:hypothetical protein
MTVATIERDPCHPHQSKPGAEHHPLLAVGPRLTPAMTLPRQAFLAAAGAAAALGLFVRTHASCCGWREGCESPVLNT